MNGFIVVDYQNPVAILAVLQCHKKRPNQCRIRSFDLSSYPFES
jgi:hypothetical protein